MAESPAAARSDGGVNRAITQVIMTMVIMATIIIRSTEMNIIIGVIMMQTNKIKMANPNTNYKLLMITSSKFNCTCLGSSPRIV